MSKISTDKLREVVQDFSKLIMEKCLTGTPIKQFATPFRGEKKRGISRPIVLVPIELLRFRAENKRINVNVKTHLKKHPELSDSDFFKDIKYQELLGSFLYEQNKARTSELKELIHADGQDEPAISTADGFLIDGNRRRYVMGELHKENPSDEKFKYMKVVLLPGDDGISDKSKRLDDGGIPTIQELDSIERIIQRRKTGKLEFTDYGEAVTIRDELEQMNFEDYLRLDSTKNEILDDPKKVRKAEEEVWKKYLGPLEICEDYLRFTDNDGLLDIIQKKGLWNACRDFHQKIWMKIGTLEKASSMKKEFNIIDPMKDPLTIKKMAFYMMQNPKDLERDIMYEIRELKAHWNTDRKSIISYIDEVENKDEAKPTEPEAKPTEPEAKPPNPGGLIKRIKGKKDKIDAEESPKNLLKAAIKKLQHKNLKIDKVNPKEYKSLRELCSDIQKIANTLEKSIYKKIKNK